MNLRELFEEFGIYILVSAVLAIGITGVYVNYAFADGGWLTVLNIFVSAALSAALVGLYFRQANILDSQRELLTAELNRSAREQHTETLRERVRRWHGGFDPDSGFRVIGDQNNNLPSVRPTEFESAPDERRIAIWGEEIDFHVIPPHIHRDRYLQDLLNNHAEDLKEQVEAVRHHQKEFSSHQKQFVENHDYGISEETKQYSAEFGISDGAKQYSLEPTDYLSQWIFEHLIKLERGFYEDFSEMRDQAVNGIDEASQRPDRPWIWIRESSNHGTSRAIYSVRCERETLESLLKHQSQLIEEVKVLLQQIFEDVGNDIPDPLIEDAADELENGKIAIEELRQLLIEYEGRPIYSGDCEYLEEARI